MSNSQSSQKLYKHKSIKKKPANIMGISIPAGSVKVINKVGKSGMKWYKVVKKYYFYP